MAEPDFSLRSLLEAGVHLGHQTHRWNPLMEPYIHSKKNGIHIINLTQTVPMFIKALKVIEDTVAKGGSILFVGTKRQAHAPIQKAAMESAQHYVNHRWLGGTLTNWKTVSNSISRLDELDAKIEAGLEGLTKKERLGLLRDQDKLQSSLGGIRNMKHVPDLLFVIDVKKESLAVAEAKKLGIPIVAVVDTNCSPLGISHIIPGNDDAIRSINLYCELVAKAVINGMTTQMGAVGVDIGSLEETPEGSSMVPTEEKKEGKEKTKGRRSRKDTKSEVEAKASEDLSKKEIKPKKEGTKPKKDSKAKVEDDSGDEEPKESKSEEKAKPKKETKPSQRKKPKEGKLEEDKIKNEKVETKPAKEKGKTEEKT